jgi:hypothetical protein
MGLEIKTTPTRTTLLRLQPKSSSHLARLTLGLEARVSLELEVGVGARAGDV